MSSERRSSAAAAAAASADATRIAAAAAAAEERHNIPVHDLGHRTPPLVDTPSPTAEDVEKGRAGDTAVERRARHIVAEDGSHLVVSGLSRQIAQPQYRLWINDRRNEAIRSSAEPIPVRRRASLHTDPVLRITEDPSLSYAQQYDALQRLARAQDIAAEERSALTRSAKKQDKDKKEKRRRAQSQCAPAKSHKRRGPSPPSPSAKPTPRAEYSTVGLGARVKA